MNDRSRASLATEQSGAPEAIEAASVERRLHGDGTRRLATRTQGIDWVRPTDLMARGASRAAGAGIDFQQELIRRMRAGIAEQGQSIRNRVRQLPPLSAFGHHSANRSTERSAVGMR